MCSKMFYLFLVFSLIGFRGFSQTLDIEWEKKTGKSGSDVFNCIIEDVNGGYTVVGSSPAVNRDDLDFCLVKFSAEGQIITEKIFGTESNDLSSGISQFVSGEYIAVGNSVLDAGKTHVFFLKADVDGNEVWQKSLNELENISVNDVFASDDGDFVTCGSVLVSEGFRKIWLAEFDNDGELLWEKTYGENVIEEVGSVKKLPDGGFAIAAQTAGEVAQESDLLVIRFNSEGNKIWEERYKMPKVNVRPECICCSPDNNFIVAGWYGTCMNDINSDNPIFDYDLFLTKISPEGELIWSKNIDSEGSEGGNTIAVRPDGKIVVAGKKETSFLGRVGTWLVLADSEGSILSEAVFPFNFGNDKVSEIISTSDGGLVLIGPGEMNLDLRNTDGWIKKIKAF
ncbi:PQQ-binding-like beta-propeller repeat protein [Maribellus comscasis]|uniref:PQQ-binding-like beta-propeller repeat protein n=1 Tax=Maribellus comscasis TaxID=2681766 RepID=A0A6I6JT83_9BACT|nr:PQQ-binding-like beta-propeller repeat protein [Maribellus comscasis]QGY43357.1 PQQ-binding-like beta-propeller repeat protein [Maribellus comscasis]